MTLAQYVKTSRWARTMLAGPIAARQSLRRYRTKLREDVLDAVEDIVQSDLRVRVDEFEGEFVVGPRSHLLRRLLREGKYEPELVSFFKSSVVKDRDVIDVGANIGFFTVLGAKHLEYGRVLAAEPTPDAFRRLKENVALNGVGDRVVTYNGLVSSENTTKTMNIVVGREEYSSMGEIVHPSARGERVEVTPVTARTLDALVEDHDLRPGLIKVDVEGAEGYVFAGAHATLRKHRPIVISELSRPLLEKNGSSPERVVGLLGECGYDVVDFWDRRVRPGNKDYTDILATPR